MTSASGHDDKRWLILAVIALAYLMIVLDVTVMNVALRSTRCFMLRKMKHGMCARARKPPLPCQIGSPEVPARRSDFESLAPRSADGSAPPQSESNEMQGL